MAMNNRDRVQKALDLLQKGLHDFVDEAMSTKLGPSWNVTMAQADAQRYGSEPKLLAKNDVQVQLRAITEYGKIFKDLLSRGQQSLASELREVRNEWAHGGAFSSEDTIRALDTIERLLRAVNATDSADNVRKLRLDLLRTVYEDQIRKRVKPIAATAEADTRLPPWCEVIHPHADVARGDYNASEFAADLHLVHTGQSGSAEYTNPVEFFNRTYLTEGLRDLLARALRRLSGDANASPVVNLQTNFGGGKTHSMLALYHLFGGTPAAEFPQEVQELISENGEPDLKTLGVRRVALVGTYLAPGKPNTSDGRPGVRTLWGELAWQLGGQAGYDIVADADRTGTNPGEALRTLLEQYSPALILVDEWVAYARQLMTDKELPAGSFETQFTFAQTLTEAVRSVPGTMLIVSIPASESGDTNVSDDIEVGGENGREALERLQNVIRRVADQWRPSSKDESFEIVRRRLFQPADAGALLQIGVVARTFVDMYRKHTADFPPEAGAPNYEYEDRIRASYPLHPELLDRLYEDWSALERFQRTRGVLKLVSDIVHELWAAADKSPLIMPGIVPLDAARVNSDLTQYIEDAWKPIIDSDIAGAGSTAHEIDLERPNLGERSVAKRIARTIFVGAAPRTKGNRKGLDKQYVWLGTATPGDRLGDFGSAIDLLAQRSTYFYEEQGHYWFDTQPSVAKTAADYAERLREDPETVWNEIVRRLEGEARSRAPFSGIHVAPASPADVPDLADTRLVIAHPRVARRKRDADDAAANQWVREMVARAGAGQRKHRNALVFLVADRNELEALEAATRTYLSWSKVQATSETLNLSAQQRKQTDDWVERSDHTVSDRIRDTFGWVMYPQQPDPTQEFTVAATRATETADTLAERVAAKLTHQDEFATNLAASILGLKLHNELGTYWRERGEITVGELWEYFSSYPYMPRLANRAVLDDAVDSAYRQQLPDTESFAVALGKDADTGRYTGLVVPPITVGVPQITDSTLLIESARAEAQLAADHAAASERAAHLTETGSRDDAHGTGRGGSKGSEDGTGTSGRTGAGGGNGTEDGTTSATPLPARRVRYFGAVEIDAERYQREFGEIMREVVEHLTAAGAQVRITLDIQATKADGFDEDAVRNVSENARQLKFNTSGFETDS